MVYCFTMEFLGSVNIKRKASLSSGLRWVKIGKRPIISGINPNDFKSCGAIYCNILFLSTMFCSLTEPKPTTCVFNRWAIFFSMPSNAPPQINKIFCVFTAIIFWSGCLRPPCGGTFTTEPSNNLSKPCCTPSPLTSRVMLGLSPLRAILSISSINTIPRSADLTS